MSRFKFPQVFSTISRQIRNMLLVLLLLCTYSSFAKESYLVYHRSIISAEEKFLKGDRPGSLAAYKQVFDSWERPFARDCFVALQICCLEKDTTLWKYFLGVAFKNGVSVKTLNYGGVVNQFIDMKTGRREELEALYKVKRAEYIQSIDFNTRAYLLSLSKTDDVYKSIPIEWRGLSYADSIYALTLDRNTEAIVRLFRKQGYKGEGSLGIIDPELDGYMDQTLYLRVNSLTPVLFYHHRCLYPQLQQELRIGLENGEVHPEDYAMIYEWSYEAFKEPPWYNRGRLVYNYSKTKCTLPIQKFHYNMYIDHRLDFKNTPFVDSCRAQISMASLDHDELKRAYGKKHHLILFFGIGRY